MQHKSRQTVMLVMAIVSAWSLHFSAAGGDELDPFTTMRREHPRLLFLAEDQNQISELAKRDTLLVKLIEQNHANATKMLSEPSVRYEIPDGRRLLAQSRKCIERVVAMAMAYRLSAERRFGEGAIMEMLVAANFPDWNPRHFLDTAEMTAALAIGYDWLFDLIEPGDRETIRRALIEHGLQEGMKVYRSGGSWSVRDNNWNQVCNGGMMLGALAIAEDEPELARQVVVAALKSIPRGLSVYQPSGAYPEGPGYWQYGTAYTCLTISALNTALGNDFDIPQTTGLDRTGWFRIHTIGPTGQYFNYADCNSNSDCSSTMFLLSRIYDEPLYAAWHRWQLAKQIGANEPLKPRGQDRFFPLEIAWYDPRGKQPTSQELPLDALFKSQQDIVAMRSSWDDPRAIYVGFKGGDNRANHGHLDIGSFVLDAGGVRWAIDLGSDNYNLPGYFGRQRWQYYRLTNASHNTLVIGGKMQNPSARCEVVSFHSAPERAAAIVDMSQAYPDQAKSVRRGVELVGRRAVHVRDEVRGATGRQVRWGMVTAAKIQSERDQATLSQNGKTLLAKIVAPSEASFAVLPNRPATAKERQNEGTSILAVQASPDARGDVDISVVLQPLEKDHPFATVEVYPLAEWPR